MALQLGMLIAIYIMLMYSCDLKIPRYYRYGFVLNIWGRLSRVVVKKIMPSHVKICWNSMSSYIL
jgi:hypothetical protein